jgi:CO dehydrogenase maturation factor
MRRFAKEIPSAAEIRRRRWHSMKIAIGGKGGVGKTTLAASFAKAFGQRGYQVLAIDADPNATLASAFGLADSSGIIPIVKMEELIAERTGTRPGQMGGMFKLNPKVDDIPDRFCREVEPGIRMMVMGAFKAGGGGCYCPENAMLKALVTHLLLDRNEVVILDMEAGIEHLGRGTAGAVDRLIVVVEPGRRSVDTAHTVRRLAGDIGLTRLAVVANKVRGPKDEAFLREKMEGFEILGFIPYSEKVIEADMANEPPYLASPVLLNMLGEIADQLIRDELHEAR